MIQNVGSHEPLRHGLVVTHNKVLCLCALVVNMELQFVCVVFASDIFLNDVLKNSFVSLILSVHEVAVVQMVRCVLQTRCVCVAMLVVKLTFDLCIYVCVSVAIVYEKLFNS